MSKTQTSERVIAVRAESQLDRLPDRMWWSFLSYRQRGHVQGPVTRVVP